MQKTRKYDPYSKENVRLSKDFKVAIINIFTALKGKYIQRTAAGICIIRDSFFQVPSVFYVRKGVVVSQKPTLEASLLTQSRLPCASVV